MRIIIALLKVFNVGVPEASQGLVCVAGPPVLVVGIHGRLAHLKKQTPQCTRSIADSDKD